MMHALLAPFAYSFMQRALVAACIVGILCSMMGTYVVLRKLAFIGDGLAHASFAGIVIAYLRNIDYQLGAAVVAVLTALGIGFVHRKGRVSLDTSIGVLFTAAFALGIFLMSRQTRYTLDLQSFLFGDILSVTRGDLIFIVVVGAAVFIAAILAFRDMLFASFDPVVAEAAGLPVKWLDYGLLVALALTIVVSLQSVGIVLVAALLVTPAAAAYQLAKRFTPMLLLSAAFGVTSTVGGLYASYFLGSSSGATIVLVATLLFFVAVALKRLRPA